MIAMILINFLKAEWKHLLIIILIAGLYFIIWHRGYSSCEADVSLARDKATREAQAIAAIDGKKLVEDNKKVMEYSKKLETKLDAEIKKNKRYTDCVVTPSAVQIINRAAK